MNYYNEIPPLRVEDGRISNLEEIERWMRYNSSIYNKLWTHAKYLQLDDKQIDSFIIINLVMNYEDTVKLLSKEAQEKPPAPLMVPKKT